jgi:hypothetical protein
VERAEEPVLENGARYQLKPTGKNESFFKQFPKSYNIKLLGIIILHHSLFFSSDFSAFWSVLCGLIIPIQPETI